ncbi:MAG: DUF2442 domain-containing protein [Chlamydiota bacterium]
MDILALKDERVEAVHFTRDALVVDLMDGRTISVSLTWYPKLQSATQNKKYSDISHQNLALEKYFLLLQRVYLSP